MTKVSQTTRDRGSTCIVVREVIGSNLGVTPHHNQRRKQWFLLLECQVCDING